MLHSCKNTQMKACMKTHFFQQKRLSQIFYTKIFVEYRMCDLSSFLINYQLTAEESLIGNAFWTKIIRLVSFFYFQPNPWLIKYTLKRTKSERSYCFHVSKHHIHYKYFHKNSHTFVEYLDQSVYMLFCPARPVDFYFGPDPPRATLMEISEGTSFMMRC